MYALYYYPGNASLLPHMMLREIGAPFELRLIDRGANAHKSAEYLRLLGAAPAATQGPVAGAVARRASRSAIAPPDE